MRGEGYSCCGRDRGGNGDGGRVGSGRGGTSEAIDATVAVNGRFALVDLRIATGVDVTFLSVVFSLTNVQRRSRFAHIAPCRSGHPDTLELLTRRRNLCWR